MRSHNHPPGMPHLLHLLLISLLLAARTACHLSPLGLSSCSSLGLAVLGWHYFKSCSSPRSILSFFPKEHLPLCAETTDDLNPPPCTKGKDESSACWCSDTQCGAHTKQVPKSMLTRVSRHEQEGIDLAARAPLVVQPGPPAAPISLDLGWARKLRRKFHACSLEEKLWQT